MQVCSPGLFRENPSSSERKFFDCTANEVTDRQMSYAAKNSVRITTLPSCNIF
jgi:hypothetical protein